jgi:NAD(P)H dehydrogenase (quinone)
MNVLIVHAHPEPGSFTTAMKDLAARTLREAGHEVVVSDLYAMKFNPVASAADFHRRANPDYLVYALEQRNADASESLAPDIKAELDKLIAADLVILSFPIFWFSTPAIMKGWIDRVLVSGRCYGGMRFYDRGGLAGKKVLVALTLGGQSHMFTPQGVHGPLEDMLKHLLRGTLGYVGFDVLEPFIGWHVPYVSAEARAEFLDKYRARLSTLETEAPMRFPTLNDFDELLHPKHVLAVM